MVQDILLRIGARRLKMKQKLIAWFAKKEFSVANKDFIQLTQHASADKHKGNMKSLSGVRRFSVTNSGFVTIEGGSTQTASSAGWTASEKVTIAETLWALKMASGQLSYASADGLPELFSLMFPDSTIAQGFHMQSTKSSYVISHGLGPFFHLGIVKELRDSNIYFTLEVDDTTTRQGCRQFDMYVRYWSERLGRVSVRYFHSSFLGHAEGEKLFNEISEALKTDGLSLTKVLQLSADGPNVSKTLHRKLNAAVINSGGLALVQIGFCNLHKVHNSFSAGLKSVEWGIESIVIDFHQWFHLSAARTEDYTQEVLWKIFQTIQPKLLYHVSSRWLSIHVVLVRLESQWEYLKEYFLKYLPSKYPDCVTNERYQRIKKGLTQITLARIQFLISVSEIFQPFLALFQTERPLVHLLYHKLNEMTRALLHRFVIGDVVGMKEGVQLQNIQLDLQQNLLPLKNLDIGIAAKKSLGNVKSEFDRKLFLTDCNKFLTSCTKDILLKSSVANKFLKDAQCLHPIARTEEKTVDAFKTLAIALPQAAPKNDIDKAAREWMLYTVEAEIKEFWYVEKKEIDKNGLENVYYTPVDEYWSRVFNIKNPHGSPKYSTISKFVKLALTISHGNADVERGFSENDNIVTKERTCLEERSIIGLRSCKSALHAAGSISKIPLTRDLLAAVSKSWKNYENDLNAGREKEKERKERQAKDLERKRKNDEERNAKEKESAKRKKGEDSFKTAEHLVKEASSALTAAIKKKKTLREWK